MAKVLVDMTAEKIAQRKKDLDARTSVASEH